MATTKERWNEIILDGRRVRVFMLPALAKMFDGRSSAQVREEMLERVQRAKRAKDERSAALWGKIANFTYREAEEVSVIPNVPDEALAKMSAKLQSAISVAMASGVHAPSPAHCQRILLEALDTGVKLGFHLAPKVVAKGAASNG
jgi:hypothetical protein